MEKLISFVIPVYNVEKYLEECIESILSQCNEQCEIILVDDGSTDNSGEICDKYAHRETIIKVIHKANGGPGIARNIGTKMAIGKYILYVDSDDRISENCLKIILEWAGNSNTDLCFMSADKIYPDGRRISLGDDIRKEFVYNKPKEEVLKYLSMRPKFPGSPCTKIFLREFLERKNVEFPQKERFGEDLGFCLDVILAANSYDAIDVPYYEYRQNRNGSRTNEANSKSFWDYTLFIKESTEKLMIDNRGKGVIEEYAMSFVAYEYSLLCWQLSKLEKKDKKKALTFLKEYKWVLNYGLSKKTKLIQYICKVFGIRISSHILDVYMKVR